MGIYERAKASWIYDLYWTLADKRVKDEGEARLVSIEVFSRDFEKVTNLRHGC